MFEDCREYYRFFNTVYHYLQKLVFLCQKKESVSSYVCMYACMFVVLVIYVACSQREGTITLHTRQHYSYKSPSYQRYGDQTSDCNCGNLSIHLVISMLPVSSGLIFLYLLLMAGQTTVRQAIKRVYTPRLPST